MRPLDLGLRTEELIARFEMFRSLGVTEIKALVQWFRPRLAVPEERIIRRGDRGTHMFFVSSGAVEVILPKERVRLGSGEFFGERHARAYHHERSCRTGELGGLAERLALT
jgi:CPA1 family monovalent cation:H+ antiporter